MRRVLGLVLLLVCASAHAQKVYNQFGPSNGVMVGNLSTPLTRVAVGADFVSIFGCSVGQIVFDTNLNSIACTSQLTWDDVNATMGLTGGGTPPVVTFAGASDMTGTGSGTSFLFNAGLGGVTSGMGGNITFNAGSTQGGNGNGGVLAFSTGAGVGSGSGGNFGATAADGGSSGPGGNVGFQSGNGNGASNAGGISFLAGSANGTGQGGSISFEAGSGATNGATSFVDGNGITVETISDRQVAIQSNVKLSLSGSAGANGNIATSTGTGAVWSTIALTGTSVSLGGGALLAGACASVNVTVSGVTNAMDIHATPVTYPGDGFWWEAVFSAANTVAVKICAAIAGTPTATAYNVRALR